MPGTVAGKSRYKLPGGKNNVSEVIVSPLHHGVCVKKPLNKITELLLDFSR